MFFETETKLDGNYVYFSDEAIVTGTDFARDTARECIKKFGREDGSIKGVAFEEAGGEGYTLVVNEDIVIIKGHAIYGALTLLQLCEHGELKTGVLTDSPDCSFRGYRVYLPGRKFFSDFYKMVDTIVYYKFNYLSLEIGGAMEYKRHPEINEAWKKFCDEMREYSGKTNEIQRGFAWAKDSIHTENGDGDILTQDEVRALVEYCRYRGLKVYPEAPTLSHSDYICLAHPEIREREEDPYPDTYCPNHPDTYKIVFDVLDEIVDVFEPEVVNIGHDELYTVGICPRCKGKFPDDLYAQDIKTIRDYLAEKGIKTMMWGEKLLPVVLPSGKTFGGAGSRRKNRDYPPMFLCQLSIPKDVIMLHWYHTFGEQYDHVYHTHNFPVIFGNLAVDRFKDWRRRKSHDNVLGGSCSNWGSNETEYMQFNCQFYHIIFAAYAFWSHTFDSPDNDEVMIKTFKEAYRRHFGDGHAIVFEHSTELSLPYEPCWCGLFIDEKKYHMGDYIVKYESGKEIKLKVEYGLNISFEGLPATVGKYNKEFNTSTLDETPLGQLCYSVIPVEKEDGKTKFFTQFDDPYPDEKIVSVEYAAIRPERVDFTWSRK